MSDRKPKNAQKKLGKKAMKKTKGGLNFAVNNLGPVQIKAAGAMSLSQQMPNPLAAVGRADQKP